MYFHRKHILLKLKTKKLLRKICSKNLTAGVFFFFIVFNYLLSIIILWGGRVECRICKWKLLSVDMTFVAAFALLTSLRDMGSGFHILLQQTECK